MFRKVGLASIGAVCVFVLLVAVLGAFAITGRSDPFTPQPTPCPIEALEKAVEDAQAAWKAVPPQHGLTHFQRPEWATLQEAQGRLHAAREGERVECP